MKCLPIALLLSCLATTALADPISITDSQGRTLSIHLLSLAEDTIAFTIADADDREFELPVARLDEASRTKVREAAKSLKPRIPPVEIDVTVGKRRKKEGYYMINQTVTTKVTIKNPSHSIAFPKSSARILFIGRNRRNDDVFKILSSDKFEVQISPARSMEFEPKIFSTSYDSDNKGYGNIGGYQYDSYIVAILDGDGKVIGSKTSSPGVRSALEKDLLLLPKVIEYPVDTQLDGNLQKVDKPVR